MAERYEVRSSISSQKARELLELLSKDDGFRAEFEKNPRTILFEHHIDISPESLPETIKLPPKKTIAALLPPQPRAAASAGATASPFGFLLLYVVFGAMPVVTGARGAGDGAR